MKGVLLPTSYFILHTSYFDEVTMSNSLIPITCVVCQHQWQEDVEKLKALRQAVIYKMVGTTSDFRIPCPKCGTVNIVTVREEADDEVRR